MGWWSRATSWLRPSRSVPVDDYFTQFDGLQSIIQTAAAWGTEEHLPSNFESLVRGAYRRSGVIWACELARVMAFSQARFQFQRFRDGRADTLFGDPSLAQLERPVRGETTRHLLARMLLDADLGGTGIVARRPRGLVRVRPDWCTFAVGSHDDPGIVGTDLDAELLGVVYEPPGGRTVVLEPDEVAIFAPMPDPEGWYRGMSWLTPILREMQSDIQATEHKLAFFRNGASPNMVISFEPTMKLEQVKRFKEALEAEHKGSTNAYKTLYLVGAKATPVGTDFKAMDFKQVSGLSETRIAAAAGVHPVILGLSEGLQGSSLNAGNYSQVRRRFADLTIAPLWEAAAAALERLVPPPDEGSRLWYDVRDVPFLREDRRDVAEIQVKQATALRQLLDAGFEPKSAVAAIDAEDMSLLDHTGLPSVQVQPVTQVKPAEEDPNA